MYTEKRQTVIIVKHIVHSSSILSGRSSAPCQCLSNFFSRTTVTMLHQRLYSSSASTNSDDNSNNATPAALLNFCVYKLC